jgi:glutathione S-transferase
MLTLYHSPHSRSSRVLALLCAMNALDWVTIREVDIPRVMEGRGRRDPSNPHPEGKVPLLVHDGVAIRETAAILLYLTDLFPSSGLGVPVGHPLRGRYLSWLSWYEGVMEPVLILDAAGIEHPWLTATYRDAAALRQRLAEALSEGPWLVGDRYTAADLLCASPFLWFRDLDPGEPQVADWVARCLAQPAIAQAQAWDAKLLAA